jgi:hypothetical protein
VDDWETPTVQLNASSGRAVSLTWVEANLDWENTALVNADYVQNGTYDLDTITVSEDFSFSVPDIVATPGNFNISTPAVNGASIPGIRSGFSLTWTGGRAGDFMLLQLLLASADGLSWEQTSTCALADDGSFNVPSGAFRNWTQGRLVYIVLGRVTYGTGTVPFNNGDSRVAGVYWNIGVGRIQ